MSLQRTGLFAFGKLKKAFTDSAARLQLLSAIWGQSKGKYINSANTLPLEISSRSEIFRTTGAGKSGISLKWAQTYAYAKELLKFYKHGVAVVWQNNKILREKRKKHYRIASLDSTGKDIYMRVPGFDALTKEMSQAIYMSNVENRTKNENTTGDVVKHEIKNTVDPRLFQMTRADYQLFRRTPKDFVKIPLFAVLFSIFVESTPLLCYAVPEVTPLTCVLPSIVPRLWNPENRRKLQESLSGISVEEYADYTAYNMPAEHVQLLAAVLRLKTRYLPASFYPVSVLRNRLQNYYNYVRVDNHYLSGMNGDGNIWGLTKQDLITACLERNLVRNIKQFLELEQRPVDEREAEEKKILDDLRIRLLQFVVNFETRNVGYLALADMVEQPDTETVMKWRS